MEYEEREGGGRGSKTLHFIGGGGFRALKNRSRYIIVLLVKARFWQGKAR
jgi:hypothetical protein